MSRHGLLDTVLRNTWLRKGTPCQNYYIQNSLRILYVQFGKSKKKSMKTKKKFSGTPLLDCSHCVDVSRLSRGNVPRLSRGHIPSNLCGIAHKSVSKSSRFANSVRKPRFHLNSPTFSREEPPNSGEKWVSKPFSSLTLFCVGLHGGSGPDNYQYNHPAEVRSEIFPCLSLPRVS